jgi:hypothetical protein
METKHTPAEWHVTKLAAPEHTPQFGVYADSQRNGHLAVVKGENADADAKLIAAAPELLAALRRATNHLTMSRGAFVCEGRTRFSTDWKEALRQAEDAIQKATNP